MRDSIVMHSKLYRSSEPGSSSDAENDMEVESIMNDLLEVLPDKHTEMNVYEFIKRNMTFESLDHVRYLQHLDLYKTQVKKIIDDLESLTWDDTVNNFVFGRNIIIVHKSFEKKHPSEKKETISKFINERLEHFKVELEKAKRYVPNIRSRSFSFPKSSIKKKRPNSSLGGT